ncbi:transient receptor potential cation channel subfamily M member 3-like isoform X2 [Mya arenaria]|uniref:transient receptor potential cation channel subfamily M member 3-like isoform X2 n=1 Tax=Mya arenaria TaxID=6604 RepID=UPI0022E85351|nr:transient receptor potential cation channel subfamily M member 3-like isoform X2 [Mya arenaria]XP_052793005.1 transient receptor potential cation channel subfamily M member 3-like isoform X2 [Mya arenaria]
MVLSQTQIPNLGSGTVYTRVERQLSGQRLHVWPFFRAESESQRSWIEKTFTKRECSKFIRSNRDHGKCCCGRPESWQGHIVQVLGVPSEERWHPYRHTEAKTTDAYGVLEFQGAPHPSKAQYVRLSSYDTKADQVLQLLQHHWGLDLPKLLITVHGGILNFDLQPKLKRVFRKGLLKAAKTTGAWIITSGTNTGVTRHVGDAISDRTLKAKNKIIAIGIAPWGIVENKDELIGKDVIVPYHCVSSPRTNYAVLNNNHSYFLLVDNGTVGKYGGEIIFRKRLEKYIAHQKICITNGVRGRGVPTICVVLEGGANTIRSVLEYVTDTPPVPVVVCDGSGRAADLLAFSHKYCSDDGTMPESLRDQLILTIQKTFQYTPEQAEKLFIELMLCVKKKELITVFRMGEGAQDIDLAILTALLKGTNASAPDQLSLALTWDRVDIARSHIFVYGQEWPEGSLEQAMMDALINDRVDFVKLLLENGVHIQSFLTIPRLEELYNTRQGPSNTLRYLVRDVRKHLPTGYRYTLLDIGLVIQHLMSGAFRATYCRKRFRQKYNALKRNGASQVNIGQLVTTLPSLVNTKQAEELFPYPFHDLMIWAVLMKRQKMALFMWQHGEEAMAKALMACKLYRGMAHEADQDDLEIEIPDEIRKYANEFQTLALELLEHCYKIDDDYTQQLLTYELKNFSEQTCLSLAVEANHREFVAHTCSQMLLNDMWMGGLRMRKNTSLKVILGILIPPYIIALEFKSKEELQLMPQTMEEHLDELNSEYSDHENMSLSSFDDDQNDYADELESSISVNPMASPVKENGVVMGDTSVYSSHVRKKKSPLRLGKKIYEFYNAPITKFWANTLFYFVFLFMYTYIVLGKTLPKPRWQEYYVMGYIATLAIEKIRQIIASEPRSLLGKFKVFFGNVWNVWDTVSILFFVTAVIVRHCPVNPRAARVLYTVNITFWYLRVMEILSVNKYLGPYLKIIVRLLREMCYFLIILLIVVASFGVVRQAIHFQDEEPSWFHVRNMFFYPYFMIYGELFADEIDTCTDVVRIEMYERGEIDSVCTYGAWISPLFMFPFLLMAIVLMVNLLIARFNACFIRMNPDTMKVWKFQRYNLIVSYELRPLLPPPLITLSHIYLGLKFIKQCCRGKRDHFDSGLKLFLSHDDMEKLHDFEEECAEDYFREKEMHVQSSTDKRIQLTNERVENMNLRMDDMNQKENFIMLNLQTIDHRMSILEDLAIQNMEVLGQMKSVMSQFDLRSCNISTSSTPSNSRARLDSEESTDQIEYDDFISPGQKEGQTSATTSRRRKLEGLASSESGKSLNPEANSIMRSLPSPILVHSQKAIKDDSLQRYTDFSKTSTKSAMSLTRRIERQSSLKHRRSLPRVQERVQEHEPATTEEDASLTNDLLGRRHGHIPKLHIEPVNKQDSISSTAVPSHVYSDDNTNSNAASSELGGVYSIAHLDTETNVSSQQPAQIDVKFATVNPDLSIPLNINIPTPEIEHTDLYQAGNYQAAHIIPFTPILTSRSAEYTTITDEIDTSCMMSRSPPRSPTSANPYNDNWDEEKEENVASRIEKAALRQAEEMEHRRMERVIRNRLRQISMDESDSISDIAKLAVSEMEIEDTHSDHEDDESIHGSTEDLTQSGRTQSFTSHTYRAVTENASATELEDSGPIQFDAGVEIRIRRASTLDEDPHSPKSV